MTHWACECNWKVAITWCSYVNVLIRTEETRSVGETTRPTASKATTMTPTSPFVKTFLQSPFSFFRVLVKYIATDIYNVMDFSDRSDMMRKEIVVHKVDISQGYDISSTKANVMLLVGWKSTLWPTEIRPKPLCMSNQWKSPSRSEGRHQTLMQWYNFDASQFYDISSTKSLSACQISGNRHRGLKVDIRLWR